MRSKHLLKYIVILALLMFAFSVIPVAAQRGGDENSGAEQGTTGDNGVSTPDPTDDPSCDDPDLEGDADESEGTVVCEDEATAEPTDEPTDEPTAAPTDEPTDEPTAAPTDEPTDEPTAAPTDEPTDEPTAAPTDEPTDEPTAAPTDEPTDEPTAVPTEEPTEEPTAAPTEEPTDEPTAAPTEETGETGNTPTETGETGTPTDGLNNGVPTDNAVGDPGIKAEPTPESAARERADVAAADDVESAGSLPGNFTSQIIAIANLNSSGSSEQAQLTLDEINGAGTGNLSSAGVFPGGVTFIQDTAISSNGQFAGILSSGFPAAAAVLTVNSVAKTADMYPGLSGNLIASTLYATRIFNKHSNFESTLVCQNAGSANTNITFDLYRDGDTSPRASVTRNGVVPGAAVLVDVADDPNVQADWAGGKGQLGFAIFKSSGSVNIACIVDSQRMVNPHVQAQYNAIPVALAGKTLFVPLVFHGHGSSSANEKALKFNTGVSILNVSNSSAAVTLQFTAENGYKRTCTVNIPKGGNANWYTPSVPDTGWTCDLGNVPLKWSYPGPTIGAVKLTSTQNILALANSNRYDPDANNLGAGYSSPAASPLVATYRVVCPLAFNKNPANDWITGIRAVNLNGSGNVNVSFKLVRANVNPASAGNSATVNLTGITPGASDNINLPNTAGALSNFQGAVFVTASKTTDKIAASASSTNYNTLSAAALYNCLSY